MVIFFCPVPGVSRKGKKSPKLQKNVGYFTGNHNQTALVLECLGSIFCRKRRLGVWANQEGLTEDLYEKRAQEPGDRMRQHRKACTLF